MLALPLMLDHCQTRVSSSNVYYTVYQLTTTDKYTCSLEWNELENRIKIMTALNGNLLFDLRD